MNKEEILALADKLYINLTAKELEDLTSEFKYIEENMELINNIEGLASVNPMHMISYTDKVVLREDEIREPLTKEEVVKNSKEVLEGDIVVPKVVE